MKIQRYEVLFVPGNAPGELALELNRVAQEKRDSQIAGVVRAPNNDGWHVIHVSMVER